MKVGFLRFLGQDLAYVYVGDVREAVRRVYGETIPISDLRLVNLVVTGKLAYKEVVLSEQEVQDQDLARLLLDVGDLL